jgi:hypothetical protein
MPGFSAISAKGTCATASSFSVFNPSTLLGPVHPFGVRRTIIGQAGLLGGVFFLERAEPCIFSYLQHRFFQGSGHDGMHFRRVGSSTK